MTSTEEKLARELGFRVCCGFVEYPDEPGKSYVPANGDLERLWRKCLELTEQREKQLHSDNCLDAALGQLHEEESPSDAPPSSELNLPCLACGKPKNDSTMHHDAPGKNWGAALHWFEAPPSDVPEATK